MRLFDLHCDTLYECYCHSLSLKQNALHLDWDRGNEWQEWRQVFAVWTPDSLRGNAAWQQAKAALQYAKTQAETHPEKAKILHTAADWRALKPHQCGMLLALESAGGLGGNNAHLEEAYDLGVRLVNLTWNGENEWGYGCGCDPDLGLKPAGKDGVKQMCRLGILPDVSHLNRAGFWEVAELSTIPFIAGHSVSAAVHPHPRNLDDEQFAAIRDAGGLVGINLCKDQLGEASFEQIERHLTHFWSLGGEDTVALGCDFDGTDLPPDWKDMGVLIRLREYLYRKNYEESLIERLFFSNCNELFVKMLVGFDK